MGVVQTVNVGERKIIGERRGHPWWSGIDKRPVDRRLEIRDDHVVGDAIVATDVHGGPDKAVYAYASEDTLWWEAVLGRDLWAGAFGENLTLEGLDCTSSVIGDRLRIGPLLLEVSQPRIPCATLAKHLGDPTMVKRFAHARRPGIYLRIIEPGDVGAGDTIELVDRPDHGVTIELVNEAVLHDHSLAARALEAPELAESLAAPLRERLA
ncbi:MAG: MOSC domain-containing protein [Solirubrobacteraceae bacterium]|nr:MOSC domain-containing protein [Solirubrobacteraceae bacterium]